MVSCIASRLKLLIISRNAHHIMILTNVPQVMQITAGITVLARKNSSPQVLSLSFRTKNLMGLILITNIVTISLASSQDGVLSAHRSTRMSKLRPS